MEVMKICISYLYKSPSSPYNPSEAIFSRDEYQSDVGNLPHMNMMSSLDTLEMNDSQMEKVQGFIRASVSDIILSDEVHNFIDEVIIDEYEYVIKVQDLAKGILSHRCNPRCLQIIGDGKGPENYKFRKPNNLNISPENTKKCHIPILNNRSTECIEKLVKIGMDEPIV